jgi:hypothetical protein
MTEPGKVEATVQIYDIDNNRISSAKFDYTVKGDPSLNGSLPADDTSLVIANESLLTDAINKADNADARITNILSSSPQPSEVVDARGTYPILKDRLDNFASSLADKASQTALNTTNANVAANTTALNNKADKTAVFTMANMGQDVRTAMTGGSVAVVGANAVLTANIQDKQVTPEKASFVKRGTNLFNKNDSRNVTGKMLNTSGAEAALTGSTISHPISVVYNTAYVAYFNNSYYGANAMAYFYDMNGAFVSAVAPTITANIGTFTVPNNSAITHMKLNIQDTTLNAVMVVAGSVYPSTYMSFTYLLSDDFVLSEAQKSSISIATNNIQDKQVTPEKTSFVGFTKNLLNKNDVRIVTGKMVNYAGSVVDFASSSISHPITAKANDVFTGYFDYSTYGGSAAAYLYDTNNNYISKVTPTFNGEIGTVTLPNDPAIAYMKFNFVTSKASTVMMVKDSVYPSNYIPYSYQFSSDVMLSDAQINQVAANDIFSPLYKKIAVFDGDSICNAINDSQDGWAGRIATKNSMTYTNYAVDGATITGGLMAGSNPRHWVSRSVAGMRSDADYIIFEGGTNDADLLGAGNLGTISTGYTATLDDTTFSGALESTFKQAILKFPGKKIGYIVAHKMGTGAQADNRKAFFDRAIQICVKWGIPYINLWDTSYLNPSIPEVNTAYYSDGQHLLSSGYDVLTPKIEAWMKTL